MSINPRAMARALGGELVGRNILAPGPGHSLADRSLSIRLDPRAPQGFIVHSFSGDSVKECRDHVRSIVGFGSKLSRRPNSSHAPSACLMRRQNLAVNLWNEGQDPRGTIVEFYLSSRGLSLSEEIAQNVIRYRPRLVTKAGSFDCMLALFRDIRTDQPCAIHRTFLDRSGIKLGRKMLGRASGAAIKLDPDEHVTLGLHIGEGVESCLAACLAGFRPVWAVGSAGAISTFPVLPAIETITILGEVDDGGANYRAAHACAERWTDAGRDALVVWPQVGGDLNDVWQEAIR